MQINNPPKTIQHVYGTEHLVHGKHYTGMKSIIISSQIVAIFMIFGLNKEVFARVQL